MSEPAPTTTEAETTTQADTAKASPKQAEDRVEKLAKRVLEAPMMSFVKGGTRTTKFENKVEREWHQAEARRDDAAAADDLAKVPIERGGAMMLSNKLTAHPEIAKSYVLLHYVNRAGHKVPPGECLADILMEDFSNPSNLTVQIICPRCLVEGTKHADTCQLRVKMSNKHWTLLPGAGKPTFVFDDGFGPKTYRSAGIIKESEPFTCADCHWRGVIDDNKIRTV